MTGDKSNWFTWILLFLVGFVVAAANSPHGNLTGRLLNTEGQVLPEIAITVFQTGRDTAIASTITSDEGLFRFVNLPAGPITIRFTFPEDSEFECLLNIRAGRELKVDFIKGTSEVIISTHLFDFLDKQGTIQAESLGFSFSEKLPLDRTFDALVPYLPGVHEDGVFNIHGATGRSNSYHIDGTEISSPYSGIPEMNLAVDSIEQQDYLISGYSPSGNADGGAIIQLTTKSGSNKLSGSTAVYFESSDFPKEIETLSFTKEVRSYEPSVTIGGPLLQGKLWFFASADYLYRNFRDDPARIAPQQTRTPLVMTKLDLIPADQWRFAAAFHGSFLNENRYYAPLTDEIEVREANIDTVSADHTVDFQLVNFGVEKRITATSVLNVEFNHFRQLIGRQPTNENTSTSTIADFTPGESALVQGSILPDHSTENSKRITFGSDFNFSISDLIGRHDFTIGLRYQNTKMELQTAFNGGSFNEYSTVSENIFRRISYDQNGSDSVKDSRNIDRLSLILNDRWQLNPNFAIEAGLTIDKTTGGNEIADVFNWVSYSPRFALVADPFGDGSTAVRAVFARYHHRLLGIEIPGSPYSLVTEYYDAATGSFETSPLNTIKSFGYHPDHVDPEIDRPYWDEFSFGIERRLNDQLLLSATALYRKESNIIEDIETNLWSFYSTDIFMDNFDNYYDYYVLEPGRDDTRNPFLYLTNIEDLERNYLGAEFSVKADLKPEVKLFAAYTWSRTKGNIDNTLDESTFTSQAYNTPNERINSYGYLSSDVRNSFRMAAVYLAPGGISLALLLRSDTGKPLNRLLLNPDLGKFQIKADERGFVYRTPGHTIIDLRLEKQFGLAGGKISLMLDVFNLSDDDTVLFFDETDEYFGIPLKATDPRSYRWGLRYSF